MMIPFPTNKHKIIQKKRGPFLNNEKALNKLWDYGYLSPKQTVQNSPPCLIVNQDCLIENFEWKGAMEGIFIGSQPPEQYFLRLPHTNIKVELKNCHCEDVGKNALTIFNSEVKVKGCAFRGNWKLNPLIEDGIGQKNLVCVNGGRVEFENCWFYNSINPIVVNTNSHVVLKNCHFSVNNIAVIVNGHANPRRNDEYWNGKEGESKVEIIDCDFFKVKTLAVTERGGCVITNSNLEIKIDGGTCNKI